MLKYNYLVMAIDILLFDSRTTTYKYHVTFVQTSNTIARTSVKQMKAVIQKCVIYNTPHKKMLTSMSNTLKPNFAVWIFTDQSIHTKLINIMGLIRLA